MAGEKKQFIDCQLFVLCGMGSTLCDFVVDFYPGGLACCQLDVKQQHQVKRRLLLMLSIATNLGILGYFKYDEFLLDN